MPEEQPAGGGEGHRARAARPVEEPLADGTLEARDLLADCGLRVAEHVGRPDERAFVGDRAQGGEVLDLDVLDPHDHKHK